MDVLVYNTSFNAWETDASIGTGSLRRKAQWLRKHPNHKVENLRGNLQKRLEKLNNSEWSGAVFAQAGLERLDLLNFGKEKKIGVEIIDLVENEEAKGTKVVLKIPIIKR